MASDKETVDVTGEEEEEEGLQELKNSLGIEDGRPVDSIDGFRKALKKKLSSWVCGADDINNSKTSPVSSFDQDFIEARSTATMTAELKQENEMDSDVYDFNHKKRGIAIIINNEDFSKSRDFGDRPGSSYDATGLHQSFKKLGFEVLHYENLTALQMIEVLKGAKTDFDHHNADCFACSILSHGDEELSQQEYDRTGTQVRHDLVFGVDGRSVATKTIAEFFNDKNCPSLKGKPRLFFLQACRGNKLDDGVNISVTKPKYTAGIQPRAKGRGDGLDGGTYHLDRDSITCDTPTSSSVDPPKFHTLQLEHVDHTDAKGLSKLDTKQPQEDSDIALGTPIPDRPDAKGKEDSPDMAWFTVSKVPITPAPLYKDCLIMYATPPGYFAWRRTSGAWFIQSLCAELDSGIVYHKSLLNVLSRVTRRTAQNYQSQNPSKPSMHEKKATPVVESMLMKDIIFTRK